MVFASLYDYNNFYSESLLSMKRTIPLALLLAFTLAATNASLAQVAGQVGAGVKSTPATIVLPDGITEEMLVPPPVPRFMLEKPAQPLTMDEMMVQAREAEKKAGVKPPALAREPEAQVPKSSK